MRLLAPLLALGLLLVACDKPLDAAEVAVETASGARHAFKAELALTDAARARGLMFRQELAADAGMLFVFPEPERLTFWMKNTYIPLDIIFIEPDGRILRIARMATPRSEAMIAAGGLALGVLEIKGGEADRRGIAEGDRVIAPSYFPPAPASAIPAP